MWYSSENSSSSSNGIGFAGALTIAFVVLKLLGKIDWSWWWVVSPIWVGAILTMLVIIAMVLWDKRY